MGDGAGRPPLTAFGPTALATWANAVTVARVALLPLFLWALVGRVDGIALGIWIALGLSDSLDGVLARRYGTTRSGAYLDPLADKAIVIAALGVLAAQGRAPWLAVGLIALRELAISLWRSLAARRGVSLPASRAGKAKTVLQFVAVGFYLIHVETVAVAVLWAAVAVTLASGVDYMARTRVHAR